MEEQNGGRLRPNTTQIPNVILDDWMSTLTEAEFKCLIYVCRRTYGFHRDTDRVSLTQFEHGIKSRNGDTLDHGTGMSRQSIVSALASLVKKGVLEIGKEAYVNEYGLNLQASLPGLVQKLDQSNGLTRSSLTIRPKLVQKLDTQKKGKERERKKNPEKAAAFSLSEVLRKCKEGDRSARLIGLLWELQGTKLENLAQYRAQFKRHLRDVHLLDGYEEPRVVGRMKQLARGEYEHITTWNLGTVLKVIDVEPEKAETIRFVDLNKSSKDKVGAKA